MQKKLITLLTILCLVLVVFAACDTLTHEEKELKIWNEALDNTIDMLSKADTHYKLVTTSDYSDVRTHNFFVDKNAIREEYKEYDYEIGEIVDRKAYYEKNFDKPYVYYLNSKEKMYRRPQQLKNYHDFAIETLYEMKDYTEYVTNLGEGRYSLKIKNSYIGKLINALYDFRADYEVRDFKIDTQLTVTTENRLIVKVEFDVLSDEYIAQLLRQGRISTKDSQNIFYLYEIDYNNDYLVILPQAQNAIQLSSPKNLKIEDGILSWDSGTTDWDSLQDSAGFCINAYLGDVLIKYDIFYYAHFNNIDVNACLSYEESGIYTFKIIAKARLDSSYCDSEVSQIDYTYVKLD